MACKVSDCNPAATSQTPKFSMSSPVSCPALENTGRKKARNSLHLQRALLSRAAFPWGCHARLMKHSVSGLPSVTVCFTPPQGNTEFF